MANESNEQDPPLYWPAVLFGGAASALFLELFSNFKAGGIIGFLLIECVFYIAAAAASISFAPERPFHAAAAALGGVFLGVLVNVFFHPRTALGFERNIFPIEAAFHTIIALPAMFIVAVIAYAVSMRRGKVKSNGNEP